MRAISIRHAAVAATLLAIGLVAVACGNDAEATEETTTEPTAVAATIAPTDAPEPTEPAPTDPPAPTDAPAKPSSSETPTVSAEPDTPTGPAGFELGDNIRGTSVISGPDLLAGMDPNDPQQANNIEDIEALLAATGGSLDRLTMLNAVAADGETFVGAIRVDRADAEIAKAAYVKSMFNDLGEARVVEAELGGKSVTLVFDDAAPDQPPLVVYASGDTVWLISGTEEAAGTVLETIP
jgi:type IV secretory pathway VirB10-like protein